MAITGTLKSGYNGQIYGGPELSTTTYEPVGTISTSQTVLVIWAEKPSSVSYCFIEFTDSSTSKKKRGYIPQNYLTLTGGTPATKALTAIKKVTNSSQNVIYGPGNLTTYNLRGSVTVSDSITVLATEGSYSFIEYTSVVGNKKRRGYILASLLSLFYSYTANGYNLTNPWNSSDDLRYKGHLGNDFTIGTKNRAFASGTVYSKSSSSYPLNGYTVTLKHTVGSKVFYTFYAHMDTQAPVTVGSIINVGDVIHDVGNSGFSDAPHVHLGVYVGTPFDNMYGYYKVNGVKTKFDDNGTGVWTYQNIKFFDPAKVLSTQGQIIANN